MDEQSFINLYDELAPKIFKYCFFRVNSKEDAEDITSQVFLRTWDYLRLGKEIKNIKGFLYQIAHNLIIDYYRKNKTNKKISLDEPENPIDVPEKSIFIEDLNKRMLVDEVREKINLLPDNYKEVIILRYIDDLAIKEIAQIMKIKENNISVLLYRATEKLKKLIKTGK